MANKCSLITRTTISQLPNMKPLSPKVTLAIKFRDSAEFKTFLKYYYYFKFYSLSKIEMIFAPSTGKVGGTLWKAISLCIHIYRLPSSIIRNTPGQRSSWLTCRLLVNRRKFLHGYPLYIIYCLPISLFRCSTQWCVYHTMHQMWFGRTILQTLRRLVWGFSLFSLV